MGISVNKLNTHLLGQSEGNLKDKQDIQTLLEKHPKITKIPFGRQVHPIEFGIWPQPQHHLQLRGQ